MIPQHRFSDRHHGAPLLRYAYRLVSALIAISASAQVMVEPYFTPRPTGDIVGPAQRIDTAMTGAAPGQAAFLGVDATSGGQDAIFSGSTRIARATNTFSHPGDEAPGATGVFGALHEPFANASGAVAFVGTVNEGNGIWTGSSLATLQLVALHGAAAPRTNSTYDFGSDRLRLCAFNDFGSVAFNALVQGAGTDRTSAIWVGPRGNVSLLVRGNDPAPGYPAGVVFEDALPREISLNNAGEAAFVAATSVQIPAPGGLSLHEALFLGAPGALHAVARAGDRVPETEAGVEMSFAGSTGAPGLNARGEVAFRVPTFSREPNPNGSGTAILAGARGALRLVARTGTQAAGFAAGWKFNSLSAPGLNEAGEIVFSARVGSGAQEVGCVYFGHIGQLRTVARTGEQAPSMGDGVFMDLGGALLLSDSGQVAFRGLVENGNGGEFALFATDQGGALRLVSRPGQNGSVTINDYKLNPQQAEDAVSTSDGRRVSFDPVGNLIFVADVSDGTRDYLTSFRATFAPSAPVIFSEGQPHPVRAVIGGTAMLSVVAHGQRPLTYQWRRNGVDVAGATNPNLTLSNLTEGERGAYSVVVTNAIGSLESATALVNFPPTITQQPAARVSVEAGSATAFSVVASGSGTLGFQWQFRATESATFANLAGANQASLAFNPAAQSQQGRYRVVITNSDGAATSSEAVLTVAAVGEPIIERLLFTGDRAPFGNGFWSGGGGAVLNNTGGLAFTGGVQDENGQMVPFAGAYSGIPSQAQVLSDLAPFDLNLGESGDVVMNSNLLSASSSFNNGLLYGRPGTVAILAQEGQPAPGTASVYGSTFSALINGSGLALWSVGNNPSVGIYVGRPGTAQLLVRSGNPAPGAGPDVTFSSIGVGGFNDAGTAALVTYLTGPGITAANDEGIWLGGVAGGVQRVVAEGSAAPGVGAGALFGSFGDSGAFDVRLNAAGQVAFVNRLTGPGIASENDDVVYAGAPGALAIVARDGQTAGGLKFVQLAGVRGRPLINAAGQVAFAAEVYPTGSTTAQQSLWLWTPGAGGGTRQIVAREGQQAPGCPAGVVFGSESSDRAFFDFAVNGAGQIVFTSLLKGPGVTSANGYGLWLTTTTGIPKLIVRPGTPFDIGGGELTLPSDFALEELSAGSGGADGLARVLDDRGELVFHLVADNFNKSGIFRATVPPRSAGGDGNPIPATGLATAITPTGAKLNGTVDPNGAATTAFFEYGLTTSYGQSTPTQNVATGSTAKPINAILAGLAPGVTYHFRLVAGGVTGADASFTTATAQTNSPPTGGSVVLSPSFGITPGTAIEVAFNGWFDKDKPLSYGLTLDGSPGAAPGTAHVLMITAPATLGVHTVIGQVSDKLGNSSEVTKMFTVVAAPSAAAVTQLSASKTPMPVSTGVPGGTWLSFGVPNALREGNVGFAAHFTDADGLLYSGIFGGPHGSPVLLLPNRGPATDADGELLGEGAFLSFREPVFGGPQQFAVQATLRDVPKTTDNGIWALTRGLLRQVAREGEPAPGIPGAKFSTFISCAMDGDRVYFTAIVQGGTGGVGLWTWNVDNSTDLIVCEGSDLVIGPNDTRSVKFLQALITRVGSPGESEVVDGGLPILLTFTDGSQAQATALSTGELEIFRRTGASVNNNPIATRLNIADLYNVDSGFALLERYTDKTSAVVNQDFGILARTTQEAPGTGAVFKGFNLPVIDYGNDGSDTLFNAFISGAGVTSANDAGLWLKHLSEPLTQIAREGNEAPGAGGARFKAFTSVSVLGNRGPVFVATLKNGTGLPKTNGSSDSGVWALSSTGALVKLLREGDQIAGKAMRTINVLGAVAGSSGHGRALGTQADMVARVFFTDGSSALVKVVVP